MVQANALALPSRRRTNFELTVITSDYLPTYLVSPTCRLPITAAALCTRTLPPVTGVALVKRPIVAAVLFRYRAEHALVAPTASVAVPCRYYLLPARRPGIPSALCPFPKLHRTDCRFLTVPALPYPVACCVCLAGARSPSFLPFGSPPCCLTDGSPQNYCLATCLLPAAFCRAMPL